MGLTSAYRLRVRRQYLLVRAFRRRRQLQPVANRLASCPPQPILLFATLRNERVRLPYFLQYYRKLGIDHFLLVDNGSDDGSRE
ncbi:MAG: glycosyl transferase family 2, partial [Rhodobacterales bacterium 17-64-5]